MRAKVTKKDILHAIMRTVSIADKKSVIPILSHVLLDFNANGLTLKATDLDHSIIEEINAEVETYGTVAIPALTLYDILRKAPEKSAIEFSLAEKGNKLIISIEKSKFELSTLSVVDFPQINVLKNSCAIAINSASFNYLISRTKISMSPEENRHNLNGIFIHKDETKLKAASTDGHRLSVAEIEIDTKENFQGIIISKKTVYEIKKLLDAFEGEIFFTITANQIQIIVGKVILISKLVDGNFPDYKRVIPEKNTNNITIKRLDFLNIVDRVSVISDEKIRAIKLELKENLFSASIVSSKFGTGHDEVEIKYSGQSWHAGFNANYLLDVAQTLTGENIKISVKDSLAPILITDDSEPSALFVVMPMRI